MHWMRNALAYVPNAQTSMVSAALRQAFIQPDRRLHQGQRDRPPGLRELSALHRTKIHYPNPMERLNREVTRRADVVGIFPNEASIISLVGAVLLEPDDEWPLQHRCMQTEAMADIITPPINAENKSAPTLAV